MATVDIILTVTRDPDALARTLESVRAQNLRDWRLLAVYDPALEGARGTLESGEDRILPIQSEPRNTASMRNLALRHIDAPFASFLEPGDTLDPAALAHLTTAARAGKHGAACGSWLVADGDGLPDGPPIDPPEGAIGLGRMPDLLAVPASACVVDAGLLRGKRFGANLTEWSHTDLWLRLCEDGVKWQVVPATVAGVAHDAGRTNDAQSVHELRSVIERSYRRASARGWDDERLDETHETETVRAALFTLASRAALRAAETNAAGAAELFAPVAAERCLNAELLAKAAAIALRYSPAYAARIDGRAERSWARGVHEWWSRCVSQKWIARHEFDDAIVELAALLVDPREVARGLLAGFGSPGRLWVGGTDRPARAVIEQALDAGWRVLVLPGRTTQGVNTRLMALPSRVMVASGNESIGPSDPLVIGSADETDLLERYGARPNVARWNGAWRTAFEKAAKRLEAAWPRRDL